MRKPRVTFVALLVSLVATLLSPAPVAGETPPVDEDHVPSEVRGYLEAVFELFLDRPPSDDDVQRWRPTAEWGGRSALTGALAVSDEWAGTRVDDLYVRILGRESDQAGHDHWVASIAGGSTLERVAAFLYGSDEYYAAQGSTAGGFVDSLYAALLGRAPEEDGRRFWIDSVQQGTDRSSIASGFYAAIESRDRRVRSLYAEILGRVPERDGHTYWADQLRSVGDVALAAFLASSDEYFVRATGQEPPATPRALDTGFRAYATVGQVRLVHPAAGVERVGFHESAHDGSQQAVPSTDAIRSLTMDTRHRGTGSETAADIVVPPDSEIRSPVTGRVVRSGTYRLYCRYRDDYMVVEPDAHPGWEVKVFHIDGVQVSAGDRVDAGVTRIAPRATVLPFSSQVDRYTAEPSWPHVHVEVIDPSVPDESGVTC